ncbi:MAG: diguanylate cyclase [Acidimicrobiales bacterium]
MRTLSRPRPACSPCSSKALALVCGWSPAPRATRGSCSPPPTPPTAWPLVTSSGGRTPSARAWSAGRGRASLRTPGPYRSTPKPPSDSRCPSAPTSACPCTSATARSSARCASGEGRVTGPAGRTHGRHHRRAWDQVLDAEEQRCLRFGHPAAVISLDLDGLKETDDSDGHAAGDAVLRMTGQVLLGTARAHDTVARVGGDEFALLAVECSRKDAEQLADRVRAAFVIVDVPASVGVGFRLGKDNLHAAWHAADTAMYDEKQRRSDMATTAEPSNSYQSMGISRASPSSCCRYSLIP